MLIVGLGNPGEKYARTRHNMGFMAVDKLLEMLGKRADKEICSALVCETYVHSKKTVIAKPLTYMNLSGESVRALMAHYGVKPQEMLIVYDDIDLPPGSLRFRSSGSAGTHNGMRNIVALTGRTDIPRLRIGVGVDKSVPLADYVLSDIKEDEEKLLPAIEQAARFMLEKIEE